MLYNSKKSYVAGIISGPTDKKLRTNKMNHLTAISSVIYIKQTLRVPITRPITKGMALHTASIVPPLVIS